MKPLAQRMLEIINNYIITFAPTYRGPLFSKTTFAPTYGGPLFSQTTFAPVLEVPNSYPLKSYLKHSLGFPIYIYT